VEERLDGKENDRRKVARSVASDGRYWLCCGEED
jgi:hypothetical protein